MAAIKKGDAVQLRKFGTARVLSVYTYCDAIHFDALLCDGSEANVLTLDWIEEERAPDRSRVLYAIEALDWRP